MRQFPIEMLVFSLWIAAVVGCNTRSEGEARAQQGILLLIDTAWDSVAAREKRPPKSFEELGKGLLKAGASEALLDSIRRGSYEILYGADRESLVATGRGGTAIAYDSQAKTSGGFVLCANGNIEEVTAEVLRVKLIPVQK